MAICCDPGSAADLKTALQLLQDGDAAGAEKLCVRILSGQSGHPQVLHLLGVLAIRRKAYPAAEQYLTQALAAGPQTAACLNDLGTVYLADARYTKALICFKNAAALDPALPAAHNNGGLALKALGRCGEAIAWFHKALDLNPAYGEAHLNLGLALQAAGHAADAENALLAAIRHKPNYAKAHCCLGDLLDTQGETAGAIDCFRMAIRINPGYVAAYHHLAHGLARNDRLDEALGYLSEAARIDPARAETFCNLGSLLRQIRRFDEALQMYQRAIALRPDFVEAHFNLSLVQLLLGDFENGWTEYEWRLRWFLPQSGYPRRHGLPLWQNQPLMGKTLLVYDEQGFGDALMFSRYLSQLKGLGARVVLEVRQPLYPLFQGLPFLTEVVPRYADRRPETRCDYCLPLCSLPGRLHTTAQTVPAPVPYLAADAPSTDVWLERLGHGAELKIGLVWSGSDIDPARRCDPACFAPLLQLQGIAWYGLQREALPKGFKPDGVIDLGPDLHHFGDTAALIENLDLVISIDTATAHLAGAMGKPVWVLLPYVPDWRWFPDRPDSPWYPTMRLYRQPARGDWQAPIAQMLKDLDQWIQEQRPRTHGRPTRDSGTENARDLFFDQGQAFHSQGDLAAAEHAYHQALVHDPCMAEAHYNLGIIRYRNQALSEAVDCFRKAVDLKPDFAEAAYNLGIALDDRHQSEQAIAAYRHALQIRPDFAPAAYNLGLTLQTQGRLDLAIQAFRAAIRADPQHAHAYNNLGLACHLSGNLAQAVTAFTHAIRIKPDLVAAYHNLGNVYLDLEEFPKTIHYYEQALNFLAEDADAQFKMGKLYQEHLYLQQSTHAFNQTLTIQPQRADAHLGLATNHLLQGDFKSGWRELQWRFNIAQHRINIYPHQYEAPLWQGQSFPGRTLLVHAEQGLGDTLQFARFIPAVKALGGQIVFEVQHSLLPLFAGLPGADRVRAIPEHKPPQEDFDLCSPLLSVPHFLQVALEHLQCKVPYLHAEPQKIAHWRQRRLPGNLHIGIVWTGSPVHKRNHQRSCDPLLFAELAAIEGIRIYSLQKDADPGLCRSLTKRMGLIHWGADLEDFSDTAAALAAIDLLISVDTSVAHLAGALARPVWTLLPYLPDWRWMLARHDSPWYPTMRLFRQRKPGDWNSVFVQVKAALSRARCE